MVEDDYMKSYGGASDGQGQKPRHDVRCPCFSCRMPTEGAPSNKHHACGTPWDNHKWFVEEIPLLVPDCHGWVR